MVCRKKILISILIVVLLAGVSACSRNNTDVSSEQQTATEQSFPKPDPNSSVDALIGSWTDINATERFANITKADTEYQYEDNEGKYPATFKDGILTVKLSDNDVAIVYVDAKTRHILSVYQGISCEYKKK